MCPLEAFYGQSCNTPISWSDTVNKVLIAPDMLANVEQEMQAMKKNLEVAHDRQKSYAYKNRVFRDFKVGEHVFLKVKQK